jgi:DNA primase
MAGRIPESFINDLLARTDIVAVIDEHVPLRKAGKNYQARCPFHEERTPSFSVNPDKQFYYCFGCGASGSAIGFLMDYAHMDFVEAVGELATRAGLTVPVQESAPRGGNLNRLYDLIEEAEQFYSRQLREHADAPRAVGYLKKRGFDGRTAADFRVGYAPPGWDNLLRALGTTAERIADLETAGMLIRKDGGGHYDRFRDRIMFPIADHRGRTIGFGGRVLDGGEPKYLNSPETPIFHKGRELYGLFQARKANRQLQRLLVVEGYMDVMALAQHGISNACATLGTATTRDHLERLFRVSPEVVFCFDGDEAGRKAGWRALEVSLPALSEGHYVSFLFMPEGEDPDTLVRSQGTAAFAEPDRAVPLSTFLFDSLTAQVNMTTLDGRARLLDLAKPLIGQVPAGAYRELLLRRLAELARIEPADAGRLVGGAATPAAPARRTRLPERASRSKVREAIFCLLHQPSLGLKVHDPDKLQGAETPGAELLREMLEFIHQHPEVSGGGLLEHWREKPEGRYLVKLLGREMLIAEDQFEAEFKPAVDSLIDEAARARMGSVPDLPPSQLSDEAKTALRRRLEIGRGRGGGGRS